MTSSVIKATVDTHLSVREADLSTPVMEALTGALSVPNTEKEKALREHESGAEDLPDKLELFARYEDLLIMPRGFAIPFTEGLGAFGFEIDWDDQRADVPMQPFLRAGLKPINLREYQGPAVEAIIQTEGGIYKAPPGSGKTVTVLEAIRRAGQRALVVLNKKDIAEQWREEAREHLGIEPGFIGDGRWDERDISVCLQQTLWSKRDLLDRDRWWERWGFVNVDECHAVTAETWQDIMQRFRAKIMGGTSATPGKKDVRVAQIMLGPVIHTTTRSQLYDLGYLIKPKIIFVPTKFGYGYKKTEVDDWTGKVTKNNYGKMIRALIRNQARNGKITNVTMENRGECILVVSDRLEQLYTLRDMAAAQGWPRERLYTLTGKEKLPRRREIAKVADEGDCAIYSTIADEALNIPRISRIIMPFPYSNTDLTRQIIGRGERSHPLKEDSLVYDIQDLNIGPLEAQANRRKANIYRPERMETQRYGT